MDEYDERAATLAKKAKCRYDANAKPLAPLRIGAKVLVQDYQSKEWNRTGEVMSRGQNRDYWVKLTSGRYLRRNRRFLLEVKSEETRTPSAKSDGPNNSEEGNRKSKRVRFRTKRLIETS